MRYDDGLNENCNHGDRDYWLDFGVIFGGSDSVLVAGFGSMGKKRGLGDDALVFSRAAG